MAYFRDVKFSVEGNIPSRLADYGFRPGEYKKIIVTWGWTTDAKQQADAVPIELWDFEKRSVR